MDGNDIPRRGFLIEGCAAVTGLALFAPPLVAHAFPSRPGEDVIPWLDQAPAMPAGAPVANQLRWEDLSSYTTPNQKFFEVAHYNKPAIDENAWSLEITGLVERPMTLKLNDLKARRRQDVVFTLECSGNTGLPWFTGGIGTAKWSGTPLAAILSEARVLPRGVEVVFFGSDAGEEDVRQIKMPQNFARSMSLADAMSANNMLCYEMNGQPLPAAHGFPVRLIAPGWYGIANVKWLKRIEVRDTRFMGRFMARDYVTIREERRGGTSEWVETSVGRSLIKSAPAKVTRANGGYRIVGAAWGAPISRVEVLIAGGPWMPATIDRTEEAPFAWRIWALDWNPRPGEHTITSRAVDTAGNVQPAASDPRIANKHTYWESNGQITRRIRIA
jgi:DMSO/TMAO reductase YedYZ molybdopterin-dependent catalytic subunit